MTRHERNAPVSAEYPYAGAATYPYAAARDYGYYGYDEEGTTITDRSCRGLIYTISGVAPDEDGSFYIRGAPGINIEVGSRPNTIIIEASPESRFVCY